MKVRSVETIRVQVTQRGGWLLVRVDTDAGISGLGEASQTSSDDVVEGLILSRLAPLLLGADPLNILSVQSRLAEAANDRTVGRLAAAAAISALEHALWDIRGKALDLRVSDLLGGRVREGIRAYANINRVISDRSPIEFASSARSAVAEGFSAIKCAPFDEVLPNRTNKTTVWSDVAPGIERIAAVREAIGPDVDLMVDCHGRFTAPVAIEVARELEPFDLYWFEDPVYWADDPDGLRKIRSAIGITVAAGEMTIDLAHFARLIGERSIDVVMADVKYCGGLWQGLKVAALAEAAALPISLHNPSGPVSTAASLSLAACLPNHQVLEFPYGEVDWRRALVRGREDILNGQILVPSDVGLGIDLDPAILANHASASGRVIVSG